MVYLFFFLFSQGLSRWGCCYGLFWTDSFLDCMASSLSGQDEPNPAMRLVARAGKMALSCALGITRCIPHEKRFLFKYNKSFIDQAWSVKMAGYCSCSFYCVFMEVDLLSPLTRWINNLANIQPSWFSLFNNYPAKSRGTYIAWYLAKNNKTKNSRFYSNCNNQFFSVRNKLYSKEFAAILFVSMLSLSQFIRFHVVVWCNSVSFVHYK